MKKLVNFILWPALAGFCLALAMLSSPFLIERIPGLNDLLSSGNPQSEISFTNFGSFRVPIKTAMPAVVSINNQQLVNRTQMRGARRSNGQLQVFLQNIEDENTTLGSGVIISPDGYIITSYHVMFNPELEIIRPEQEISVTLNDRRNIEAKLISLDARNDLALLKIDAENLTHLPLADSSNLLPGDIVLAIGNPRNVGQSASFGIVSALWETSDSYVIQHDAAINPGNSGGALIDTQGKLIGINSTIVSESGGSEGISFAVPASKALNLLGQHLTAQKLDNGNSAYLGINGSSFQSLDKPNVFGVYIYEVTSGSAASMADIRVGDIIKAVNGRELPQIPIDDPEKAEEESIKLFASITAHDPGELIMLDIIRNETLIKVPVILGIGEPKIIRDTAPGKPQDAVNSAIE